MCARCPSNGSVTAIGFAGLLLAEVEAVVGKALAQKPCTRGGRLAHEIGIFLAAGVADCRGGLLLNRIEFLCRLLLQLGMKNRQLLSERVGRIAQKRNAGTHWCGLRYLVGLRGVRLSHERLLVRRGCGAYAGGHGA